MTESTDRILYLERKDPLVIVDLSYWTDKTVLDVVVSGNSTAVIKRGLVETFKESALGVKKDYTSELLSYDINPFS